MSSPALTGILFSSTEPKRLADWYRRALPPTAEDSRDQYHTLKYRDFYLIIDTRDDVAAQTAEPGRVILNFEVDDAKAAVERIDALGATWLSRLEDRGGNWFATAIDPDGNYVQVIQLSDEEKAQM